MLKRSPTKLALDDLVCGLKAAGEPTRLRILALLAQSELTVKDLTFVLGQSQPRISRHLKLMADAGLIDRFPEGAWVYYRLADDSGIGRVAKELTALVEEADPTRERDVARMAALKLELADRADRYFAENAERWDQIRSLQVPEEAVEAAICDLTQSPSPVEMLVDLGTGTGRMLDLLQDRYQRAIGVDVSAQMLSVARAKLADLGLTRAQVRRADVTQLELPPASADLITVHQVLHFLPNPVAAISEAARVLKPSGRLLIVDFAPHDIEQLRRDHAHQRLGFSNEQVHDWLTAASLTVIDQRELSPGGASQDPLCGDNQLTIMIWLAEKRTA